MKGFGLGGSMQNTLTVVERTGEGVARVIWMDGGDIITHIWVRSSRAGGLMECQICGKSLKGKLSYRPAGSPHNRNWRICIEHVEAEELKKEFAL
jgi:hypothetical protein